MTTSNIESHDKWTIIEMRALEILWKGSTFIGGGRAQRLFQIVILPSFGQSESWEVLKKFAEPGDHYLVHTCWRRDIDWKVFEGSRDISGHARRNLSQQNPIERLREQYLNRRNGKIRRDFDPCNS